MQSCRLGTRSSNAAALQMAPATSCSCRALTVWSCYSSSGTQRPQQHCRLCCQRMKLQARICMHRGTMAQQPTWHRLCSQPSEESHQTCLTHSKPCPCRPQPCCPETLNLTGCTNKTTHTSPTPKCYCALFNALGKQSKLLRSPQTVPYTLAQQQPLD